MKKRSKKNGAVDKEKAQQIRNLEVDLKYTVRAIDARHQWTDEFFGQQAEHIRNQIKELKR